MNTRKKLTAVLMAAMIIGTIGAVFATAQTDGTTPDITTQKTFRNTQDQNRTRFFDGNMTQGIGMFGCFDYNLTTDQQTELQQLMTTLRDQNATPQEMQSAIQQKLEEFGVFDTQLDNQIAQTEQRLTILNREKELRNQGYNWTEVRNMIQNEFDLQNSTNGDLGMMQGKGFRHGPHGGPQDGIAPEESDQ
jgi:Spy/CpxP family protein refolding chaperone